jgi:hypothetical protein
MELLNEPSVRPGMRSTGGKRKGRVERPPLSIQSPVIAEHKDYIQQDSARVALENHQANRTTAELKNMRLA